MAEKKFEYTLTLTTEQAREIQDSLEVVMRWMLKQPEIMREYLPDRLCWDHGENFDISLAKRKAATEMLKAANDLLCPYDQSEWRDNPLKNDQWHRIYGIYQVIRHAIWEAESDKKYCTVDGNTPMQTGEEPLPKIEWKQTS